MTDNNQISFEDPYDRGKYARELRGYFEKHNINLKDWWPSASIKTPEILIHPLNGSLENERQISRISLQINEEGKISFGLSSYNYKFGDYLKNEPALKKYKLTIHKIEPKKNKNGEVINQKEELKLGRLWRTTSFDGLEDIALEFNKIKHSLM